jgi:hypothetical protein
MIEDVIRDELAPLTQRTMLFRFPVTSAPRYKDSVQKAA